MLKCEHLRPHAFGSKIKTNKHSDAEILLKWYCFTPKIHIHKENILTQYILKLHFLMLHNCLVLAFNLYDSQVELTFHRISHVATGSGY